MLKSKNTFFRKSIQQHTREVLFRSYSMTWCLRYMHSLFVRSLCSSALSTRYVLYFSIFFSFNNKTFQRGGQRLSCYWGWLLSSILITISICSYILAFFDLIDLLQFIYYLSYVKMAVTSSKYAPQAIQNYSNKSTKGFSIHMALADFSGGLMAILQMLLQASNTRKCFIINTVFVFFDYIEIYQPFQKTGAFSTEIP